MKLSTHWIDTLCLILSSCSLLLAAGEEEQASTWSSQAMRNG